jgi:hypothetical protein
MASRWILCVSAVFEREFREWPRTAASRLAIGMNRAQPLGHRGAEMNCGPMPTTRSMLIT